jgi:superfamily II DNA or RNA helicase
MITLYPDQEIFVSKIRKKIKEGHKSIICQAPTGFGKTVVFSYIAKNALSKGNRVLILTHRTELLSETGGTLFDFGMKPEYIKAGTAYPPQSYHRLIVGMAQTLKRRIHTDKHQRAWSDFFKSFDIVILDEAHLQDFNDFFYLDVDVVNVSENLFNGALILGFTATPQRTGSMRMLGEDYTTMVLGPSTNELIEMWRLMPDNYYAVKGADLKGVSKNSIGDFQESEMYDRFKKIDVFAGAASNWLKHTPETITLVFCVNIQHVIDTCEEFEKNGINAKFVTSEVSKPKYPEKPTESHLVKYNVKLDEYNRYKEAYKKYSGSREQVINEWKNGEYKVLVNAGILTTGFNFKPIETIILYRGTTSDNLFLQMIGRGSRPSPETGKKFFNTLDFGGHKERLGGYRDRREYSLTHKTKKSDGVAPVKECGTQYRKGVKKDPETGYYIDKNNRPGCGSYLATSIMVCPYCGYLFETEQEKIEAELELIDTYIPTSQKAIIKDMPVWSDIEKDAELRGYKQGWVIANILSKYGEDGLKDYAKNKGYHAGWVDMNLKRYGNK